MRVLAVAALLLWAAPALAGPPPAAPDYGAPSSWLCSPDKTDGACTKGLDALEVSVDGSRAPVSFPPAADPPIDCFYVYPTASREPGDFADMAASPELVAIARRQAGRLASRCRLYAPIYRQITDAALGRAQRTGAELNWKVPYFDVRAAWRWYLANANAGRGVVLVGHSQGAILLKQLIASEIDGKPVQTHLVGAFLAGDPGLPVPQGARVGGAFKSVPLCQAAAETGCVYVWADYPADAADPPRLFGQSPGRGMTAGCVTPAAPGGGAGALKAILPKPAKASPEDPPSIELIGQLSSRCKADAQGDVAQVSVLPGRQAGWLRGRLEAVSAPAPEWGLHELDLDLYQGNILDVLDAETAAYIRHSSAALRIPSSPGLR